MCNIFLSRINTLGEVAILIVQQGGVHLQMFQLLNFNVSCVPRDSFSCLFLILMQEKGGTSFKDRIPFITFVLGNNSALLVE